MEECEREERERERENGESKLEQERENYPLYMRKLPWQPGQSIKGASTSPPPNKMTVPALATGTGQIDFAPCAHSALILSRS